MTAQKSSVRASYSNSINDNAHSGEATKKDEKATRAMYEYSPYPDLGADLKSLDLYTQHLPEDFMNKNNVYLDAGCGTGHIIVGMAKRNPQWRCMGVDLSQASLNIAQKLSKQHGTDNVTFYHGSYLEKLPVDEKFDLISAMGTVHHCADPIKALQAMHNMLNDDGYLLLHMYGWRADRGKFDIKNILDILEPDITAYESRFGYYRALQDHKNKKILKRILNTSIYDLYTAIKVGWRNFKRRTNKVSWSPPWDIDYKELSSPWIDHFCHPCERAYEVQEIQDLIEKSGFSVFKMLAQGREFPQLLPPEWADRYAQLDEWEKSRLSELLATGGGSFAMILQKEK